LFSLFLAAFAACRACKRAAACPNYYPLRASGLQGLFSVFKLQRGLKRIYHNTKQNASYFLPTFQGLQRVPARAARLAAVAEAMPPRLPLPLPLAAALQLPVFTL